MSGTVIELSAMFVDRMTWKCEIYKCQISVSTNIQYMYICKFKTNLYITHRIHTDFPYTLIDFLFSGAIILFQMPNLFPFIFLMDLESKLNFFLTKRHYTTELWSWEINMNKVCSDNIHCIYCSLG
jgi:hypothetical protein